jgi:glycogen operon protein
VIACGANPDDHVIGRANNVLGILFAGRAEGADGDDVVYMAINAHWEPVEIRLPALRAGLSWGININTDADDNIYFHKKAVFLKSPLFLLKERSVAVFTLFHQ